MANDKSILYSSEESDRINQLIQSKIASHLFLACNYAPSPYLIQSEDAKFVVGILNLYKFAIDGSIIDKIPQIMDAAMGSTINRKAFAEKIKLVKALRSVYCHNESEISGNDDDIKTVNSWMQKTPQTINDYRMLNQQLQKLASDIVAVLDQFIKDASKTRQKDVLIKNWEGIISNFYQRPNTKNILKGQLKKFYSARKGITSMGKADDLDMVSCVRKYYIGDLEQEQKVTKDAYERIRKLSLPDKERAKMLEKIKMVEDKLENRKKKLIVRLGDGRTTIDNIDRNDYPYLELYMKELPQRIIDFIGNTQDTNVYGTLLPQDIVQYILKLDFDSIMR